MRAIILGCCLGLAVFSPSNAQPPAASLQEALPQTQTVILVDASRSMGDRLDDGSTAKDNANAILFGELKKLSEANTKASINFFRAVDTKSCNTRVAIGDQLAIPDPFPQSPSPVGATNAGAALEAALDKIGAHDARIVIISDGGQSSECGFHICTVAEERLRRVKNIKIDQLWAVKHDGGALPFPCVEAALQRNATPQSDQPTKASIRDEGAKQDEKSSGMDDRNAASTASVTGVTFLNSLPWAVLAILFAISFGLLGNSFAKAHRNLEIRLRRIDQDAANGTFVDFAKQKPRFRLAILLFVAAAILSFVVLWGSGEYIAFARTGAANALNNEFGAAVFLACLVSLGAFAGSQYWRYAELRADYGIASNEAERVQKAKDDEIKRQRDAKAEQEKVRLATLYDGYRAAFSNREYHFEKYLVAGDLKDANGELMDQVVSAMKFLAAGAALSKDSLTQAEADRIGRFTGMLAGKSPYALIGFIPGARLPEATKKELSAFFYTDEMPTAEQQNKTLKLVKKELDLLVTQHSS